MSASQLVVMLAAERSGTHFFRSVLSANQAAFAPGEVANAGAAERDPFDFFRFRHELALADPAFAVPSAPVMRRLLDAYADRLRAAAAAAGRPAMLCDIKYGHVVNFAGGWWDLVGPPYLVLWLRQAKVPVLHLMRRNLGDTVLSRLYAQRTGVWRTRDAAEVRRERLRIERAAMLAEMARLRRVMLLFRGWLAPNAPTEAFYEELEDGASASWQRVRGLLGHPVPNIVSDFVRTTPPAAEVVENLDEVADLLGRDFLAEAPPAR